MNEAEAIGETAVAKESASEKSSAKIAWFGKASVPLWWLGLGAVGSLIPEGSVADWTGILLHENYNYTKVVAASAFTVFAVAMIISRLGGDFFLHKFGGEKTMRIGGLLAGLAMGFGILFARFTYHSHPAIALVVIDFSFFCGGIGIGPMFPYFMLAAGSIKDVPPAIGISRVGAIGISSYFIGPSVIGALAQTFTLPYALMYPIILLTSVGIFAKKMVPSE
jgi:fucose permease